MNRRDALVAGLLSASLMALLVPLASLGVDQHHDGIMLKPALDVLSGQVLFRDTFTQYGALTTYLQVVALWIQPTLLSMRLMTVMAYGVTLFFLYASWRLILPRSLTIISCGLFILFIPCFEIDHWTNQHWLLLPWSSVFAMMFQSIGLYALFRLISGEQPVRWGMILGLACACVFWCRQPVGVLMTGSVAMIWLALCWTNWAPVRQSKRSILAGILGGFVAVNALLLGDILISGALPEWWCQNFVWPRRWSASMNWDNTLRLFLHPTAGTGLLILLLAAAAPGLVKRFRPNLSSRSIMAYYLCLGGVLVWQYERVFQVLALRDGGWSVLFPLVVLLQAVISLALAFVARDTQKTTEYYLVAALAALSLGSLSQYYPMADSWHMLWALAPAFGLIVFVFWRGLGWSAPVVALALTAAFLPSIHAKAQSAAQTLARPLVTLAYPSVLRGMKVPPEQARSLGQIMNLLEQILRYQPNISSALIGNDALFLCFTNNHANPSPYYVTWRGLADNGHNVERWSNIQQTRPLMFLHRARWGAVDDFYRSARYVPLLYIPEEALEIAVPQELAETMGLTAYGATPPSGPAKEPLKP